MDLNTPENLDPKLREAYERTLGQGPHPTPVINRKPFTSEAPVINNSNSAYETIHKTIDEKPKKYKTLFLLIGIFAVIFLIAYGVVWAKIFNLI